MFYRKKTNTVFGPPECAKSWLLAAAAAQELNSDRPVLWVDFEDTAASLVGRLLALGVDRERLIRLVRYVRPSEPLPADWPLPSTLTQPGLTLAVIDGVTDAMALLGLDPNSGSDAATFFTRLAFPIASSGAAVVLIDHVVKNTESRGRYATGSQHKLAAIDGAAYTMTNKAPFGHGKRGISTIDVAKDRPGHVREHAAGDRFADLILTSEPDGTVFAELHPPAGGSDQPFRPTTLMARVSSWLQTQPDGASGTQIENAVPGKATGVRTALKTLTAENFITAAPGRNGGRRYHHNKPFTESDNT